MKKILYIFFLSLVTICTTNAQFFQGSFEKDVSSTTNLKILFKVRPIAAITTGIAYMEVAFRYPTATTTSFSINTITPASGPLGGLSVQRFTPDVVIDGYTYVKFVSNTAILPSASYAAGTQYPAFSITTSLPGTALPQFEMISNFMLDKYQFGLANGTGNLLDAGNADQLYGPGFYINGNDHILPLSSGALPVIFRNFTVIKNEKDALITWVVDNQDASTNYFDIERSENGIDFTAIKRVQANLNSGASATYNSIDYNVSALGLTTVYYRIKQVDKDGRFVYTIIRNIKYPGKEYISVLYPNPASKRSVLSFYMAEAGRVNIMLIDAGGKLVENHYANANKGLNQKAIDVTRLSDGIYNVILRMGEQVEALKMVIRK